MSDHDARIGENVRRLREAKGLSQAALAERMREAGWKWSQPTVAAIEKGDRSLKFAEAVHLCSMPIFDVTDASELLRVPHIDLWWAAAGGMERSAVELSRAAHGYAQAQHRLRQITADLETAGLEVPEPEDSSMLLLDVSASDYVAERLAKTDYAYWPIDYTDADG